MCLLSAICPQCPKLRSKVVIWGLKPPVRLKICKRRLHFCVRRWKRRSILKNSSATLRVWHPKYRKRNFQFLMCALPLQGMKPFVLPMPKRLKRSKKPAQNLSFSAHCTIKACPKISAVCICPAVTRSCAQRHSAKIPRCFCASKPQSKTVCRLWQNAAAFCI